MVAGCRFLHGRVGFWRRCWAQTGLEARHTAHSSPYRQGIPRPGMAVPPGWLFSARRVPLCSPYCQSIKHVWRWKSYINQRPDPADTKRWLRAHGVKESFKERLLQRFFAFLLDYKAKKKTDWFLLYTAWEGAGPRSVRLPIPVLVVFVLQITCRAES